MKKSIAIFLFLIIAILVVPFTGSFIAFGQPPQGNNSREEIRARMVDFLRYVELENSATPADVDKLVELWSKAAQAGLSLEDRSTAFRDLYVQFQKMHGADYSS